MKHKYRNIGLPVDINLGLIYLTNYSSNDLALMFDWISLHF